MEEDEALIIDINHLFQALHPFISSLPFLIKFLAPSIDIRGSQLRTRVLVDMEQPGMDVQHLQVLDKDNIMES